MLNFEYYAPTRIIFGKDTHLEVGSVIKEYGFSKILLHYGKGSIKESGIYDEITKSLIENKIEFAELGGVEPNPKLSLAREGIRLCKAEKCELVLAVGGGSVIDSAKLIAIGSACNEDVADFISKKKLPKRALPVATVLTLSASGSEMSTSSVITDDKTKLKRGFTTQLNRPLFSICNPCLTYTVGPYQTACGIVDILMHTLERYFTVSEPFSITDQMALGVVKTVLDAGKKAILNPCDYEARANLMWAGSLSHNGLTGLGTEHFMGCHQIEHEISGMYDSVSHGAGLAVVYPAWARYVYKYRPKRFANLATEALGIEKASKSDEELALLGIKALEDYFVSIGMPVRLCELGIDVKDSDIEEMAEKCTFFGERKLTDYVPLDKREIIEIFNLMREER